MPPALDVARPVLRRAFAAAPKIGNNPDFATARKIYEAVNRASNSGGCPLTEGQIKNQYRNDRRRLNMNVPSYLSFCNEHGLNGFQREIDIVINGEESEANNGEANNGKEGEASNGEEGEANNGEEGEANNAEEGEANNAEAGEANNEAGEANNAEVANDDAGIFSAMKVLAGLWALALISLLFMIVAMQLSVVGFLFLFFMVAVYNGARYIRKTIDLFRA